jgi:hypothetical protein
MVACELRFIFQESDASIALWLSAYLELPLPSGTYLAEATTIPTPAHPLTNSGPKLVRAGAGGELWMSDGRAPGVRVEWGGRPHGLNQSLDVVLLISSRLPTTPADRIETTQCTRADFLECFPLPHCDYVDLAAMATVLPENDQLNRPTYCPAFYFLILLGPQCRYGTKCRRE